MFLIRAIFWLSIVVALIPVNPADLKDGQRPVSTLETLGAAQAFVSDLGGFCDRNPQACGTANELFSQFGAKARTGMRYVSAWLEQEPAGDTATDTSDSMSGSTVATTGQDPVRTGTVAR
ncbi:MAG: DUF5330 domain-containing protein [Salaquimonas sp.]|jgi:hypothetical protein|nr:DUF5330 domain-containing protein [Salaquimonas sp.]